MKPVSLISLFKGQSGKTYESKLNQTKVRYEYSPESFTGTELPFAKQICEAVMER